MQSIFFSDWCVLQIFFYKYISFKFKALFLHINWQCLSLACVTNSISSGSSDTVSLSWIQCITKFNRANMYLSTFRKTATNQNSQFENNRGRKTWGFLEKSCFTFCDFHWVFFFYCTRAPMILKRKEKAVVGAHRKCEIGCIAA